MYCRRSHLFAPLKILFIHRPKAPFSPPNANHFRTGELVALATRLHFGWVVLQEWLEDYWRRVREVPGGAEHGRECRRVTTATRGSSGYRSRRPNDAGC